MEQFVLLNYEIVDDQITPKFSPPEVIRPVKFPSFFPYGPFFPIVFGTNVAHDGPDRFIPSSFQRKLESRRKKGQGAQCP